MIIGNYYINNFLVAAIVLALLGGVAYFSGFPGGGGQVDGPADVPEDLELVAQGEGLSPGGSQVMRLVSSNGTAIDGAEVIVNGEEVGQTGENGQVTFQVPESPNITISASKSGVEVTRTFELGTGSGETGEGDGDDSDADEGGKDSGEDDSQQDDGTDEQDDEGNETDTGDQPLDNETESNETKIEASIQKIEPEGKILNSTEFEAVFELAASNASYSIDFSGDEQASGDIDGEINVSPQLSVPGNGSYQLNVEITRQEQVLASQNYTLNYSEPAGNETDQAEEKASVTAMLDAPEQIQVGEAASFDASGSSGDIVNYSWSFGDGNQETTQSATLQHSYSSEDTYEVTVTVNGENNTEDSASATLDVLGKQAPTIHFLSPVDGYETDQTSLTYEFEVDNAASDAQYTVLIDESGTASGSLEQGNNTVQETIDIPETLFNTSIRVQQGGETYNSGKRTVNATQSSRPQPEFTLNSPQEGGVLETLEQQTSVSFEYEITDRKWATSANLTVTREASKVTERPVSVVSGNHEEKVSDLEPGNYTYTLEMIDDKGTVSRSNEFEVRKVEPEYSVSLVSPQDGVHVGSDNPDDFQTVGFNVSFETDTDGVLGFEIIAMEDGSNTYQTDDGSGGEQTWTTEYTEGEIVDNSSMDILEGMDYHHEFENTFDVAIRYKWRSWIAVDGGEVKSTSFKTLNVTEEPE